jgi:hypothetical protein
MKGHRKFGKKGRDVAYKEVKQLHNRVVVKPINVNEPTELEKRRHGTFNLLLENRDRTAKSRTCANRDTQREYTDRDEAASPTAMAECIVITGVINAKQSRDVVTGDIPNAFVQTDIDKRRVGD